MYSSNFAPVSATRTLRKFNLEASLSDAPETQAAYEMLRSHIDDAVVRAQNNLNRQRGPLTVRYRPAVVYARGGAEDN